MTADTPSLAFTPHDHAQCRDTALSRARAVCARNGWQFTAVRQATLGILLDAHRGLGAYEVLAKLEEKGFGGKPPVAYRALGFLVDHGFAHRLEKGNAYVACDHPGEEHHPAFMVCKTCGMVAETRRPAHDALDDSAEAMGFSIDRTVVEAEGTCAPCRESGERPQE